MADQVISLYRICFYQLHQIHFIQHNL